MGQLCQQQGSNAITPTKNHIKNRKWGNKELSQKQLSFIKSWNRWFSQGYNKPLQLFAEKRSIESNGTTKYRKQ